MQRVQRVQRAQLGCGPVDDRGVIAAACARLAQVTREPLYTCLWPVLRGDTGTVQFGLDPTRALVLSGVTDDQVDALRSLDGTHRLPLVLQAAPDLLALLLRRGIVTVADDLAVTPEPVRGLWRPEVESLVRAVGSGRVGAVWSRRTAARVLVVGRGAVPSAVATLLRRAGVGTVAVVDAGTTEHPGPPAFETPTLVVHTAAHALDPVAGERWRLRGIPVLPVVVTTAEAVIGPLCTPGAPCLRCLDLTRADLDPRWPSLLGQLTRPRVGPAAEVGGDVALVSVAASLSATIALSGVDGAPTPVGRSLEVSLPWPAVRQRQWEPHPQCDCGAADTGSGQPSDEPATAQVRMAG